MGSNLFGIGFGELIFLAILALIVFGPKRIPELARTIGRLIQQLRQATTGIEKEVRQLMDGEGNPSTWLSGEPPSQTPPRPAPRAMPFTPFVPPQSPGAGGQSPAENSTQPQGQGQPGEVAPAPPTDLPEQDEPQEGPPAPSSLSG